MKFEDTLANNITCHWKDKYIDYEFLKSFMKLENWKNSSVGLISNELKILNESISESLELPVERSQKYGSRVNLIQSNGSSRSSSDGWKCEEIINNDNNDDVNGNKVISPLLLSSTEPKNNNNSNNIEMEIIGNDVESKSLSPKITNVNLSPLLFSNGYTSDNLTYEVPMSPSIFKSVVNSPQVSSSSFTSQSDSNSSNVSKDIFTTPKSMDEKAELPVSQTTNFTEIKIDNLEEYEQVCNFQSAIIQEVDKVQSFYEARLKIFKTRSHELLNLLSFIKSNRREYSNKKDLKLIKSGFKDNYYCLSILSLYRDTNKLGFDKIILKYTKFNPLVANRCKDYLLSKSFYNGDELALLISQMKIKYAKQFTGKDLKKAKNSLKSPKLGTNRKLVFSVGILIGLCFLFIALNIYLYTLYYAKNETPYHAEFAWLFFRISLLPIALGTFFSIQSFVWEKSGINYTFIFNLKPEYSRSSLKYLQIGLFFILFWLLSLFLYIESTTNHSMLRKSKFPSLIFPIVFLLASVIIVFNPFPILSHKTRFWVVKRISMVLRAPFVPLTFADFFMSVQLLTLAEFFFNIQSFVCISNYSSLMPNEIQFCKESTFWAFPLLNAIPFYFRVMQCFRRYYETKDFFPHITSAIRSIFSIVVLILGYLVLRFNESNGWSIIKIIWLVVNIIGSFYKWVADMTVDWGFFWNFSTNQDYPLRSKLHFKRKWVYYFAMVLDLILRYMWLFVFIVKTSQISHRLDAPLFLFFYSMLEVIWATQFIFFRVEFEHVQLADKYGMFIERPIPFMDQFKKYIQEKKETLAKLSPNYHSINNHNE